MPSKLGVPRVRNSHPSEAKARDFPGRAQPQVSRMGMETGTCLSNCAPDCFPKALYVDAISNSEKCCKKKIHHQYRMEGILRTTELCQRSETNRKETKHKGQDIIEQKAN